MPKKNQSSILIAHTQYFRLFKGNVYKLHGDMDHQVRKEMFSGYNTSKAGILISTDVAARGLDFQGVRWIIHYDVNREIKEYVNRVGRTARLNTEVILILHKYRENRFAS